MPKVDEFLAKQPAAEPKVVLDDLAQAVKPSEKVRRPAQGIKQQVESLWFVKVLKQRFPASYELLLQIIDEWNKGGQFDGLKIDNQQMKKIVIFLLKESYRIEKSLLSERVRAELAKTSHFFLSIILKFN